jgi:hypothetical protein
MDGEGGEIGEKFGQRLRKLSVCNIKRGERAPCERNNLFSSITSYREEELGHQRRIFNIPALL